MDGKRSDVILERDHRETEEDVIQKKVRVDHLLREREGGGRSGRERRRVSGIGALECLIHCADFLNVVTLLIYPHWLLLLFLLLHPHSIPTL
jgi:hypothetical protein